ncbi:MAG TPA: hypothetical protein VF753_10200 [Terriglobales bacterium]
MKRLLRAALLLLSLIAATAVSAFPAKKKLDQYVDGTVVNVQSQTVQSAEYSTAGSNQSDAPLTSNYYEYDVSIRVGCMIYVGRYLTPFHYLPSLFDADHNINFRLTKRVMYFDLPDTAGIRMAIIHRRNMDCAAAR